MQCSNPKTFDAVAREWVEFEQEFEKPYNRMGKVSLYGQEQRNFI